MTISAAKLDANRRNALKSTGPRTEEGKKRSSRNAVTHGLRAETLVLHDEDPQVLEDRRAGWRACLLPGDDVEERLVDDAVVYTWMQDRARRAQAGRINANFANFGVDQDQASEKEVEDLGRRLFQDRLGPLVFYPSPSMTTRYDFDRRPSTSFAGERKDDPDRPGALVLCLQATLLGCEWMLGEWARLKAILDEGQAWLSSDKLKAVRLLGKQPFDCIDERDVAVVFLASFVLRPDKGSWDWEIAMELADKDIKRFRNSAAARELNSLKPRDAAKAREALSGVIERATDRLTKQAEAHRERARVLADLAADFLAFDDSPAGERLRRFDLASGRGLARSLAELRRHRQSSGPLSVVSDPLSVVGGPSSVVGREAEALSEANAPSEANELGGGWRVEGGEPEMTTNEPTDWSGEWGVEDGEPEMTTNEPNGVQENVTNEPNNAGENVTSEPKLVQQNATNEPNDAGENVTNEPKVAAVGEGVQRVELTAGMNGEDQNSGALQASIDREKVGQGIATETTRESFQAGNERIRRRREEFVRKLNEGALRDAEDAMAARRARLREQKNKNRKPAVQPKGRETRTGQRKSNESGTRTKREIDELANLVRGLYMKMRAPPR